MSLAFHLGDLVLELRDERGTMLRLHASEVDSLMAALELLRTSAARGLSVNRVDGPTFTVCLWKLQ